MPFVLALAASALIHAAALLGPGWELPVLGQTDPPPVEAVLMRPVTPPESMTVAKPEPKVATDKPRRLPPVAPSLAGASHEQTVSSPAPPIESPPPVAVSPVPSLEPAAPTPVRIGLPGKGRMRYSITRGEGGLVVGQAVHTWEHDGLIYKLQSVTETTGLAALFKPARVVQTSQGDVVAEGLKPREFRHERIGGLDIANFDWARGIVTYAGREERVVAGTQDMLSMYYQLVLLMPKNNVVDMPIATGRKLEKYHFEIVGEESVDLLGGERRAMRLRTRSGSDTIELWLGVGKDADARGLPLKIRFIDRKGEIFDQLAEDIDPRETQ